MWYGGYGAEGQCPSRRSSATAAFTASNISNLEMLPLLSASRRSNIRALSRASITHVLRCFTDLPLIPVLSIQCTNVHWIDQYCTVVSVCRLCHWWIPLEVEAKAVRWLSPCCHPLPGMSLNTPGPGVSCSFIEFHGVSQQQDFEVWFRFSLTRKNYSKITCCIMLPPWQRMLPSLWTWFAAFTTSDLKGDCIKV